MNSPIKKIPNITPPYPFEAYTHIISPLAEEDGGGFLFMIPDLPGCMADGKTEAEALKDGRMAFTTMVSAMADMDRPIPVPTFRPDNIAPPRASGRFVTRLPKSLHARLVARAKNEGVSLNALVASFLAEGLGRK